MVLGKVRLLSVILDSPSPNQAFSGGDAVTGRVLADVTGDVRVKRLDVTARGVAKVRWTESRNAGANTAYSQNYTEEVEYLNHRDTLIGDDPDDGGPEESLTVLHPGLHEFAFSFNLPHMALATSFEGKHGSVRYWVKAELHRPWMLPVRVKKEFIVFEHIDINTPLLLAPQAGTKEKTLCCWFCESVQVFSEVENCSSRVVVPKAALYQTQTFYAKGKGKQIQRLVAQLRGDPLQPGKTQTWEGKSLKIPPVSPSILDCPIIRVEYMLVVYVDVPRGLNLSLSLPLVIGTIPLHSGTPRTGSISSSCSAGSDSWTERPEAPPSYNELQISESQRRHCLDRDQDQDWDQDQGSVLTFITEFRYRPPPLYSEVDPYPDTCPSR